MLYRRGALQQLITEYSGWVNIQLQDIIKKIKVMEPNEAPEKIYVQLPSRNWIGRTWNETPIKEGDNPNWKNATNIEYIRKDAFIEKTSWWIEKNIKKWYENIKVHGSRGMAPLMITEFKKHIEGE